LVILAGQADLVPRRIAPLAPFSDIGQALDPVDCISGEEQIVIGSLPIGSVGS